MRFGFSFVAARPAFEGQRVLTELVAQFVDVEFARHGANCCDLRPARPSSTHHPRTLYEWLTTRFRY
jgi:hypothetical protein